VTAGRALRPRVRELAHISGPMAAVTSAAEHIHAAGSATARVAGRR
jgi:hypothetical protein